MIMNHFPVTDVEIDVVINDTCKIRITFFRAIRSYHFYTRMNEDFELI